MAPSPLLSPLCQQLVRNFTHTIYYDYYFLEMYYFRYMSIPDTPEEGIPLQMVVNHRVVAGN